MSRPRFAFSNIAWTPHDDAEIFSLLRRHGITGIEIAPTAVWGSWEAMTLSKARAYRQLLSEQGFEVPALQAIVYGKPEARLFEAHGEAVLLEHFALVAAVASGLEAPVAVLGAPSQRDRGGRSWTQALEHAAGVLRKAAVRFHDLGCCLCIEPNPRRYGCNFVNTAAEGIELVAAVDHPGFRLHLDAAGMYLEREDLAAVLPAALSVLRHFHLSEPDLGDFRRPEVPHTENLYCLTEAGYAGWCSVEMRRPSAPLADVGPWAVIARSRSRIDV
ncbi:MAG: sugar phosphate isomerase/epimerase family protein [Steroidobacteraceae bacterium]